MVVEYPYIITLPHLHGANLILQLGHNTDATSWRRMLGTWHNGHYHIRIAFKTQEDAIEFKLKWL